MSDLVLQVGEAVFTGAGKALSGAPDGAAVVLGADDHGSVEIRCAAGETVRCFIGGVPVFLCETIDGVPKIRFEGTVEAHGFVDLSPQP